MEDITGVILAGGKSSRMGKNKALLPVNGMTNIERMKNELEQLTTDVVIAANDKETYQFLNKKIISDVYAGKGPLAGIHGSLAESKTKWNLFIACDMPFFSTDIASYLIEKTRNSKLDGIVPMIDGRIHPLYAVYKTESVTLFEDCLKKDQLRIRDALSQLKVEYVTKEELVDTGINAEEIEKAFYNMNHPEEYDWVIEQLKKNGC
ncbi:molybdenum cofactor guanylyltransferase [Bacillus shivajii]|uniref:molybdenum cofactor guanylyltransferase n=1 Tax=Bacillus shivajii TaxID=1983719 RepID=UPI001CFA7B3C|nr:molybdenum cofactor guanylyltransferase [Bacillus shivajii]UCZ52389.1 molybdenum cofactor guanylyltransferase [Bacillus shivajii]